MLLRWLSLIALIALGAPHAGRAAEPDFLRPEQAFQYRVSSDGHELVVHWNIAKGYYVYLKRMGVESGATWAQLGTATYPTGEIHKDEYFGEQTVFRNAFDMHVPITLSAGAQATLPVVLKVQGCADAGLCYPPQRWTASVALPPVAATPAPVADSASNAGAPAIPLATQSRGLFGAQPKAAAGEPDFLPVDEAFRLDVEPAGPDRVRISWQIADGYYLYRDRIKVASSATDAQLGALSLPTGKVKNDEFFGRQEVYHDELVATLPVAHAGATALELPLAITYQGCAEAGLCYPPQTRKFAVNLPAGSGSAALPSVTGATYGAAAAVNNGAAPFVSEQDRLARTLREGSLALVIGIFFVAGLLLAFTPCVLPMVPILSGIIAGGGGQTNTRRAFILSLTYVLGMSVTYTIAGIAAAAAGKQVQAVFQQPWIIALFALLFIVLAISMFGAFTIQMPSAIQTRLSEVSNRQSAGTLGGVAVMGALSSLIVTACVAPPLFAALAVIGQTGDLFRGGVALFTMSLGMGTPLMIIGTSAGNLLPRAGAWMDTVKKFFGVMMLGVAAWMLARIVPERIGLLLWAVPALIGAWLLWTEVRARSVGPWAVRFAGLALGAWGLAMIAGAALGGTDPLAPIPQLARHEQGLTFERIKSVADLERAVASAARAGRPVMLDFYADWCVSCKEMEKYTFTDATVRGLLGNAVLLQADVTANDAADQALLKAFGIFGPPTIAFYAPDGVERSDHRVVGFMKAAEFANVIRDVSRPKG
jgi:thiol:disulfide interchange protein DsbD